MPIQEAAQRLLALLAQPELAPVKGGFKWALLPAQNHEERMCHLVRLWTEEASPPSLGRANETQQRLTTELKESAAQGEPGAQADRPEGPGQTNGGRKTTMRTP